jgi:hypothetical protein
MSQVEGRKVGSRKEDIDRWEGKWIRKGWDIEGLRKEMWK